MNYVKQKNSKQLFVVRISTHKLIALNPDCLEIGGRVGQGVPAIGIAKFCAKNAFYESSARKSVSGPQYRKTKCTYGSVE